MPKPISASERGLPAFWKIRLTIPGSLIHLASRTEPVLRFENGRPVGMDANLIEGTDQGDTVGFIDWAAVAAVTWRIAE